MKEIKILVTVGIAGHLQTKQKEITVQVEDDLTAQEESDCINEVAEEWVNDQIQWDLKIIP